MHVAPPPPGKFGIEQSYLVPGAGFHDHEEAHGLVEYSSRAEAGLLGGLECVGDADFLEQSEEHVLARRPGLRTPGQDHSRQNRQPKAPQPDLLQREPALEADDPSSWRLPPRRSRA